MSAHSQTPQEDSASEIDPNSLAAIRKLLEAEPEIAPQPVEQRVAEKAAASEAPASTSRKSSGTSSSARATKAAPGTGRAAFAELPQDNETEGRMARLKSRVTGYRPTARHVVLACAALLILFRPWLVAGLLFLGIFIITGIFLVLGYDGFWRRAMAVARWHARRNPERSVELHLRLDNFAVKFDAFLDRFPEGTVDGLYLPDFGDVAEAEARHDAALDRRFETLRETGV